MPEESKIERGYKITVFDIKSGDLVVEMSVDGAYFLPSVADEF